MASPLFPYTVTSDSDSTAAISTVIIDSIAADTVPGRIPHFIPAEEADSLRQAAADSIAAAQTASAEPPSGLREGLAPAGPNTVPGGSTALSLLLMVMLVVLCLNGQAVRRALKSYSHELIGVRRRRNVFDDERTVPLPVAALLAVNLIVFGGIVLYNIPRLPAQQSFAGVCAAMAVTAIYCIFRYVAYEAVGYVFATPDGRRQWLDGFLASEAYTGLMLIVPAFLLIYRPEWHSVLIIVSLSVICVARLLFIAKGVRIFYVNLRSLLYFILYLCSLEIIPLLALFGVCSYMQTTAI